VIALRKRNELLEWVKIFIAALLISLIVRIFLFTPVVVEGESMNPTLKNNERLIVSKVSSIDRFDIIVFHGKENKDFVKRVIGLPGDKIEYRNDVLYINDQPYEEEYLEQAKKELKRQYGDETLLTENFTLEELLGHKTVPKNTLFVMGDNRQKSLDSRIIGFIPMDQVIGEAKLIYWPPGEFKLIR